jgi:two-component system, OmpR family, alkaline phosphatase synthesis response regulator PhoP
MVKGTVLVIDDESDIIELIRYNLEKDGFEVRDARDGESGVSLAFNSPPDVILLDLMLPGMDGLEVCRRIRTDARTAGVPIIMLTARGAEPDRIVGLEMGADDYVTKPFSPRELTARIRALLRRTAGKQAEPEIFRRGDLRIDLSRREVNCGESIISVTATEFKLLQFLASRPGRVFSRGELIDGVLGRDVAVLDRTIDVHVVSLRKKLKSCGHQIETVRGFGYRLREADEE